MGNAHASPEKELLTSPPPRAPMHARPRDHPQMVQDSMVAPLDLIGRQAHGVAELPIGLALHPAGEDLAVDFADASQCILQR